MKKLILSTTIVIMMIATACKTSTSNKNNPDKTPDEILDHFSKSGKINVGNQNYKVAVPNGWTTKDTSMNNIAFFFLLAPQTEGGNFNTNINIINESMQNMSFDSYKSSTIATMKQYMPSIEILDKGDIEASSLKGSWFSYKMEQNGIKINAINYTFPKDGIAYIITATTKEGTLDKYRSTFDGVAKSLSFKGE